MSDIVRIDTKQAPAAIGPYSQGLSANGFVFVSGQIGLDPQTGKLVDGGVASQTERVLLNIKAIVEAAGTTMDHVVRCDVYLSSMGNFAAMNDVYAKYFPGPAQPARVATEVSRIPKDALVEISAVAVK
ncbi:MAG TPA: RidA family protein [Spirochaetota bacterium]|nr:RidA family protein [Spirochaetota bacterium]